MREILFRGQSIDRRKWYEGDLYQTRLKSVFYINYYTEHGDRMAVEVDPETVGQYTGLTDKNGTKIFEGDIVIDKYSKEKFGFVGVVIYNPALTQYQIYSNKQPDYVVNLGSRRDSVKIIGNIHDNPELLGGEG